MRRLRVRCKVVLWFLILVMVFADLFMIFGKALVVSAADDNKSAPTANNRIRTNIQWAQKKTFSEMNASDIENLTYDDLRMIGVFLSNFYVPFKTKLGASSDEVSKQIQADMVKCLTDYCNFDKDTATPLAKAVMAMSLTDASAELKIGCVKRAKREGSSLSDVVTGDVLDFSSDRASMIPVFFKKLASENNNFIPATYARFMYMYSRVVSHNDYSSDRVFKTTHTDYDVCLFWEDGNKSKHIVMTGASFDNKSNGSPLKPKVQAADISSAQEQFHLEWSDFTPSSLAYALLNDESDYKNGFGNSVVSVPEADYKEMTADQKKLTLATNAKMYIDCFGNIFQDTGVAQEVVFPACVNPYVWYDASGDGTATTGNTINLVNTFFIGEIERSEKCIQLSNPNGLTEDGRIKSNGASTSGSSSSNVSLQDKAAAVQQGLENALNSSGNLSDFVASSKGILGRGNVNRKAAEAKESQSSEQEESKEGVSTPSVLPECTFKVYTGDYSLFNTYKWRTYQGRDSIEFTDGTITDDYKDSLGCADSDEIEEDKVSDVGKTGKTIMFPNWLTYLFAAKVKDGDEDELDEIADNVFLQDADEWQPLDNQKYQKVAHEDSSDGKNSFCDVIDVTSVGSDSKTVGSTKYSVPTFMDMIMIDNLGLFESSNPDDSDTLQSVTLFNRNGGMLNNGSILGGTGKSNKFGMSQADKSPTTVLDMGSAGKQYLVSIFLSYVFAYYDNSVGDARKIRWAFAKSNIPDCKAGALDFDDLEIDMNSQLQSELMSMAYYIMHPKEGLEFVKQWARNKISSIVVGWHEDMVGKSNGVSTTGSTRYIGFSGYVTMPNLRDLSWTDWLLNKYNSFVVYFIVLILVVMLGYVMVGSLSFQRAMVGVMIFGLCAYLPATVIDTTVNASNMLCDSMYSSKFTYWALAQHYQYQSQLNSAIESGNRYNYLSTIFQQQIADTSADYAVVALKWQCPKKENYMANVRKEIEAVSASPFIYKMATGIIGGQVSGETFLDSVDNLYLSRSYTDVANYSKSIADTAAELRNTDTSFYSTLLKRGSNDTGISGYLGITRDKSWNGYFNDYFSAMSAGFVHSLRGSKTSISNLEKTHINHIVLPLCSNPVKDALSKQLGYALGSFNGQSGQSRFDTDYLWDTNIFSGATIKKAGATDKKNDAKSFYVSDLSRILTSTVPGLSQQTLNMTLKTFNQISKQSPSEEYKNLQKSFEDLQSNNIGAETSYADKYSMMSTFAFTQYTESPYYYLSLNLRDQLDTLTELSKKTCDYKDLFLIKDSGYFFNTSWNLYAPANEDEFTDNGTDKSLLGYGEMRDYADMRSLFSVIIPYLKRCNDIVIAYDRAEGLEMFDDIEVTYDANYNLEVPSEIAELSAQEVRTSEIYRKYLHNVIVSQLLNIYCPWVDILYSCDYAQPEKISVAGETFKVEDPLDPSSYHDDKGNGRNMVFSRAEMAYYGLRDNDLTEVESRIIKMYDNLYEELLPLMDYYTFGNDVLNTGAAMLETFEFNKQFSQRDWFGEDYTLYPQNYELRNFSYDAFLRLILSGTTGDDIAINYEGGYYHHVIENSGIFTGILFILIDILAVYAIPALKLFFLILIFFLSVVVILCATVKLDMSLPSVLWKSLIGPLLKFFVVTVGFAFVVSLFMSDGNTAVTGRGGFVISLGSPAMTIIVMLVINILVLVLYAKIVKTVLLDAIKYTKAVASSFSGMIGGLAVAAVGIASAGKLSSLRSAGGTGGGSGAGGTGGAGGVGGSGAGGVGGSGTADARGVANTDIKNKGSSRQAVNNTKTTRRMAKANKKLTKSNEKATKAQNKYNKRIQDFLNKSNSGLSHGKPAGNSPEVTQERTQGASRAADRYSQQANSSGNTQSNSFNDKIQQRRKERLEKQQNFTQRNKMSGGANSAIQRSRKPKRVYSGKSKRASVGSHGKVKGKK